MGNTTILNLPVATSLVGDEYVEVVQAGTSKRASVMQFPLAITSGIVSYVLSLFSGAGGSSLVGTPRSTTVEQDLTNLNGGLPSAPAIIQGKYYLTNYLSQAQINDVAAQTGLVDCSAAVQAAASASVAANADLIIPDSGLIRINNQVSISVNPSSGAFGPGLRMRSDGFATFSSAVANAGMFNLTSAGSNKFQKRVELEGLHFTGKNFSPINGSGFTTNRTFDFFADDCIFDYFLQDGIYNSVVTNDSDSSNEFIFNRCDFSANARWHVNQNPTLTANDLSFLTFNDCTFYAGGTSALVAISSITGVGPLTVTTAVAHGFTTGQEIRLAGVFGMLESSSGKSVVNDQSGIITVISTTQFTIPIAVSGSAYTSGGFAMPAIPTSGGIKCSPQMLKIVGGGFTEHKNCSVYIGNGRGAVPALQTNLRGVSIENTTGYSIVTTGTVGMNLLTCDLRINQSVGTCFGHLLMDATSTAVQGVRVVSTDLINIDGATPIIANSPFNHFIGVGGNGGSVIIDPLTNAFGGTNSHMYNKDISNFSAVTLFDENGELLVSPGHGQLKTLSTASPSFSPDIRSGNRYIIQLSGAASGTLTISKPIATGMASSMLQGQPLEIIIVNNTAVTVNLSWGFGTKGAPTTIAAGDTKSGQWRYSTAYEWIQSAAWI